MKTREIMIASVAVIVSHASAWGFSSDDRFTKIVNETLAAAKAAAADAAGKKAAASAAPVDASAPSRAGLVAEWLFDETSGGLALDNSGNGNTLALNGDVTRTPGVHGNALVFNGKDSQKATAPESPTLSLQGRQLTFEAWILVEEDGIILSKSNAYDLGVKEGHLTVDSGNFLQETTRQPREIRRGYTRGIVPYRTWTHLAVVYDETSLIFYVNGKQRRIRSHLYENTSKVSDPYLHFDLSLGIKTYASSYPRPFRGMMDEVRVFNTARSAQQVREDYLSTPAPRAATMTAQAPPNGNVVFLWGSLDQEWVAKEQARFQPTAQWLERNGFRVRYEPKATEAALRRAVQDPDTSIILWSGVTSEDAAQTTKAYADETAVGLLVDAYGRSIDADVFANASPRLRQVVLGGCHGDVTVKKYPHDKLHVLYFDGKVTMTDLFDVLEGEIWAKNIENDFGLRLGQR